MKNDVFWDKITEKAARSKLMCKIDLLSEKVLSKIEIFALHDRKTLDILESNKEFREFDQALDAFLVGGSTLASYTLSLDGSGPTSQINNFSTIFDELDFIENYVSKLNPA